MRTYTAKPADVRREWHVVDAAGQTLGRLAVQVATLLRGKHKAMFTPHLDTGDFVIVVNAAKVRVTGRKLKQKQYARHSGYPGGFKTISLENMMAAHPTRAMEYAVQGMLPKGPLGRALFRKLKVYAGPTHPHESQILGQEHREKVAERAARQAEREAIAKTTAATEAEPTPATEAKAAPPAETKTAATIEAEPTPATEAEATPATETSAAAEKQRSGEEA